MGDSSERTFQNSSLVEIFESSSSKKTDGSGAKRSNLPPALQPSWFDAEDNSWSGQKEYEECSAAEKRKLQRCAMKVEFAPTGRAKCRRCGEAIDKDTLRFGYPYRYTARDDPYCVYLHLECYVPGHTSVKPSDDKDVAKMVLGYAAMSKTEQHRVKSALAGRLRPKAAKEAGSDGVKEAEELARSGVGDTKALNTLAKKVKVPTQLTEKLLPFQKEGLAWMCRQEENWEAEADNACMGGILADEMGMGKTIQALALLLARRRPNATLVVVPLAAVTQWVGEIERFVKAGQLRVMVYHGADKRKLNFKNADVVICSYQTLECDYRREMNKSKVRCKYCGKMFTKEKLGIHQRYFCGPDAIRTAKLQKTQRKDKQAAIKGMQTMGITSSSSSSSSAYVPPTVTNIFKETMAKAGVQLKGKGYWNVVKEVAAKKASDGQMSMARERLNLMSVEELRAECAKHRLDKTGKKEDLVDRLNLEAMRKMGRKATPTKCGCGGKQALEDLSKTDLIKLKMGELKAKAKELRVSGDLDDLSKQELVAAVDKKLCAARGQKRKASAAKLTSPAAKLPRSGFARTVAEKRRAAQEAAPAKGKGAGAKAKKLPKEPKPVAGSQLAMSPLHSFKWSRIILDEAHRIKGRTNSTAMAAYALCLQKGGFRWCLTGTPLQNRVGELYSLIRFLEFKPFAFYYCKAKGCDCESCSWHGSRYCSFCGHNRMMHYSYFKAKISNPIIKYGFLGAGREAFTTLRAGVLDRVMLRRTKEEKKGDLKLPPIKVSIRKDKLSQPERDFYESIFKQSQVGFSTYVQKGTVLHNYAHIFDLLTSLRRAVDHPYLIIHGTKAGSHQLPGGAKLPAATGKGLADVCALCQDDIDEDNAEEPKVLSRCGHAFHKDCALEYMQDAPRLRNGAIGCPACFAPLELVGGEDDEDGSPAKSRKGAAMKSMKAMNAMKAMKVGGFAMKVAMKVSAKPPARTAAQRRLEKAGCASPGKGAKKKFSAELTTPPRRPSSGLLDGQTPQALLPKKMRLEALPDASQKLKKSGVPEARKGAMGRNSILQKFKTSEFSSSTKVEAVLDEVEKMRKKSDKSKALIFSQFSAMLELIEFRLKRAGISCLVFRGGMSIEARDNALRIFRTDPTVKVILISLKAGGEGLNLQVADHVFLVDPWWNPACELQAIQRAHRIGQTREVKAVRFICTDTVEERMLALQEKKQLVFDGTVGGSQGAISKLTEQDLHFLFQH